VDQVFADYDRPDSPGCALGIYRSGRIVYARGYGVANLEQGVPITPTSVFDIGSTSKQFTAMSIALLAREGRLSLDDDIRKWIPEMPEYARRITIRHLLHHTSGIRDYLTLMSLRGTNFDGVTTDRDALGLIVRQRATNFEPGSEYLYSNSGYFLLGEIVRRVSGTSLATFAQGRIFAPLGMRQTHIHDDHTMIVPHRATGYAPRPGGGFRIDMSGFEQTGDGSVMTTVEDLLFWDRNFYAPTVGDTALLRVLLTQGRLTRGDTLAYAMGLVVGSRRGLRYVRHGGAWAGYRAELLRFPDHHTSIACLCNLASARPSTLADRVADIVLGQAFASAQTAPGATSATRAATATVDSTPPDPRLASHRTPEQLAPYTGNYYSDELDATFTITAQGGTLVARTTTGEPRILRSTGADTFSDDEEVTFTFERDHAGRVSAALVSAGRVRGIRLVRERSGGRGGPS
jgi:CubicO group peptidase (beta-lactamase class C family)